MKKLVALFLLWGSVAFAQTPQAVQGECIRQMNMGICIAQNDGSGDTPGASMLISGAGRVPLAAYRDYTRLANPSNPQDVAMCSLALDKMVTEPGGPHDIVARALWMPMEPEQKQTISQQVVEEFKTNSTLQKTSVIGALLMLVGLSSFTRKQNGNVR